MSGQELSGVDLARVVLRASLETARKNGGRTTKVKTKLGMSSLVRRGRREPMRLGDAIGMLVTERAWELPAAGASLRERWAAIAPDFARYVGAVGYDADSGRLTVCPESAAWATKLRLEQARVIGAANESAGRTSCAACGSSRPVPFPVPELADVPSATAAASTVPFGRRSSRRRLRGPLHRRHRRKHRRLTKAHIRPGSGDTEAARRPAPEDLRCRIAPFLTGERPEHAGLSCAPASVRHEARSVGAAAVMGVGYRVYVRVSPLSMVRRRALPLVRVRVEDPPGEHEAAGVPEVTVLGPSSRRPPLGAADSGAVNTQW